MKRITSLAITCVFILAFSAFSSAAVQVGGCLGLVNFATIQAAVDASPAGTTIDVCPGTYAEQVVITKSLTIKGIASGNSDAAVIVPPAGGLSANAHSLFSGDPIAAQIAVLPAGGSVNISNITVDGNNNGLAADCSAPELIGILYQNGSGTVSRVVVMNQVLPAAANGCQNGLGIFVQSGPGGTSKVTVSNSFVQNYQKNGITGNESGTTLTASGNTVLGQGPTSGAAENSIQIGFGATGTISGNTVGDDIWAPDTIADPGDAAAGILVFDAAGVNTTGNTVASTQYGIAYVQDAPTLADGGAIKSNKISGTHIFDGIDVCSDNHTVTGNSIIGSDESAIHFDTSCGGTGVQASVGTNTINGACAGILRGNLIGNPGANTFFNVTNKTESGDTCTPPLATMKRRTQKLKPARP